MGHTSVPTPDVGVIGGSGFATFLDDAEPVECQTPFGSPSAPIAIGHVQGRAVAFLPRHGPGHRYPAHMINYRANIWALRALGVRQVLAPCAVGSLRATDGPGVLVVPDQVLDRTRTRRHTFHDVGAAHVQFADPYCPVGRDVVVRAGASWPVGPAVDGGTMAVIEGPRFSTRAESRELAGAGATLVNMTGMPEAGLARELALCYTAVALVTDRDAGIDATQSVTQAEVFALFAQSVEQLKGVMATAVAALPVERTCPCPAALDGMTLAFDLP